MARERLGTYNVVATYQDMEQARDAMAALQRAGIDGGDISVLGRQADEARAASEQDPSAGDTGVMGDVTKATLGGAAAGATAGGVAGFIAGALAFGIPGIGPVLGTGIWAATLGGATLGGGIGAHMAGIAALSENPDWELTYQEALRNERVLIAAHADDRADLDRAVEALRTTNPLSLEEFDQEGRRLTG